MENPSEEKIRKGSAENFQADVLEGAGESRRRFAKIGLGSAGVVLTLSSTSGMATTITHDCPSRVASTWHSGKDANTSKAEGRPPLYWCSSSTSWPRGCSRTQTTFGNVCGHNTSEVSSCVLLTVMKTQQSFDPNGVYMYAAAMYLNILSQKVTFITVEQLQQIIYEYMTYGAYKPSATVKWGGVELGNYFKQACYTS